MKAMDLDRDQLLELAIQQSERIAALEQQLRLLLLQKYRPSSEKVSQDQLALFDSPQEAKVDTETEDDDKITVTFGSPAITESAGGLYPGGALHPVR